MRLERAHNAGFPVIPSDGQALERGAGWKAEMNAAGIARQVSAGYGHIAAINACAGFSIKFAPMPALAELPQCKSTSMLAPPHS